MTAPRDPGGMVASLILAAGGGRRLGGVAKALLDHDGELLVDRAVVTARRGGCDPIVVVLGADADSVRLRADLNESVIVINEDWRSGMGSSLRAGLAAIPSGCSAVAILLVDQPFVEPEAVRAVLDAHGQGADIVSAVYRGRRGHPVLFAAKHWEAVARSAVGDQGARAFLMTHESGIVTVPCDTFGDPRDIDAPVDLSLLRGAASSPRSGES